MEERRLGANAVTEGWAMLLQHLTDEPAWLTRRLDVPRPQDFAREGATGLLYFVRRYCAKLLYEIEFHAGGDVEAMRPRYVELLSNALKIEPSPVNYLADIDSGFYVYSYLRSWAFEAQLRDHLRERFGTEWFASRETGSLLRELWSEGQKPTADELLREKFGNAWFSRRDAGSLLRELWGEGQRQTADELLKEVTGAELEMEAVADRVREEL